MAEDQKPKTMDINDLVRELSKSSTSTVVPPAPTSGQSPMPQASRPSFPTQKPLTPPPAGGSMAGSPPVPPMSRPPIPTPAPSKSPEMPQPKFTAPPPASKPAPAPLAPSPLPTPGVKEYQSSIRTMNKDISNIKQGQKPMGIDVPRKVEQAPATPQPVPVKPTIPSQPFKVPSVNLGGTQKAAPIAPPKDIARVPSAPKVEPPPQIYIPEGGQKSGNRNILFMVVGAAVLVAGFSYWFFVLRSPAPEVVVESPTPTPTQTTTPVPSPFEKLAVTEKVSVPSTGVFSTSLTAEINSRQPIVGQIRLYDIVDENQQKYSFKEFLTKLSIDTSGLNDSGLLDTKEWVLGLYGQVGMGQGSSVRYFIVLTQNDSNLATTLMNAWEPRIIINFSRLFNFLVNSTSAELPFTSDIYSGINFRFVRMPDKDLGVSYAIFKNYLVLGSSRDSFRAVLDALSTP